MADGQDDYLSDKWLVNPLPKENSTTRPRHHQSTTQLQRQKPRHIVEAERREEGLRTRVEHTEQGKNKGAQLLAKMGFSEGEGLGKRKDGRRNPLPVEQHVARTGIGWAEKMRCQEDERRTKLARAEVQSNEEFQERVRASLARRRGTADLLKAIRVWEELDSQEYESDGEDVGERTPEDILAALHTLLRRLRDVHHYCLYCGCRFFSTEDMEANCPGLSAEDHE